MSEEFEQTEWTAEQWGRLTAALAALMRERFGEGELLPIDNHSLFVYRAAGGERYADIDDTDSPPREDARGAFYEAHVSASRGFEPDRTETVRVHF